MQNFFRVLVASAVVAATCVSAAPHHSVRRLARAAAAQFRPDCNPQSYIPTLPENQTKVAVPEGEVPVLVAVVFGTQSWSCGDDGVFVPTNSSARLFDFSCFVGDDQFPIATIGAALSSVAAKDPAVFLVEFASLTSTIQVASWDSTTQADGSVTAQFDTSISLTVEFPDPKLELKLVSAVPSNNANIFDPPSDNAIAPSIPTALFTVTKGTLAKTLILTGALGGVPAEQTCKPGETTEEVFFAEAVLTA